MRRRIDPKVREEPRFPTILCPWCDTPIGLWEEVREDGIWNATCSGCGVLAALFAPLSLDTRVFLA
jgi:hypothetical protein